MYRYTYRYPYGFELTFDISWREIFHREKSITLIKTGPGELEIMNQYSSN